MTEAEKVEIFNRENGNDLQEISGSSVARIAEQYELIKAGKNISTIKNQPK